MSTSALPDDRPSPWWPCPRCGDVFWRPAHMVWERQGINPDTGADDDPDYANKPSGVSCTNQCANCHKWLDLSRYYDWAPDDGLRACPDCGHFTRDHVAGCEDCDCSRTEWAEGEVL